MRDEIKNFAEAMEKIMGRNDFEKGDSWKVLPINFLECKAIEEYHELLAEFASEEIIDLACVLMMLWNRKKEE